MSPGAERKSNITSKPDITCLGKVIGGGLPVGAYAARTKLMEQISPSGPVYQAGTLSGNPLAMNAGIITLEILKEPGSYETLEERSARLENGLLEAAQASNVPVAINRVGSMLTPFFTRTAGKKVTNFADATAFRYAKPSRRSSTRCSITAFIFRPANMKRGLSAWRTATK